MKCLFLFDLNPLGFAEKALTSSKSFDGWYTNIIILFLMFCALSEPFKVFMRKDIGIKALSLKGTIGSATIYLTYSTIMLVFLMGNNEYPSDEGYSLGSFYFSKISFLVAFLFFLAFAFLTLFQGMDRYYSAKANSNEDVASLEYRGVSTFERIRGLKIDGWKQDNIWRIAEPKYCFWRSFFVAVFCPLIGIPLMITSTSFWVNEWYHVYYKKEKENQDSIDLANEIKKADANHRFSAVNSQPTSYVSNS